MLVMRGVPARFALIIHRMPTRSSTATATATATALAPQAANRLKPSAAAHRAPAYDPAQGLSAWLAVVRTYQTCVEVLGAQVKPLGLKLAQHDVLLNLLHAQPKTQQQLAEGSFVTKSHMSAVLTEMEQLGWITRMGDAADKRSKAISLTAAGQALAQQAFAVQADIVQTMMGPLAPAQIEALRQFSRDAQQALQAYAPPSGT